MEIDELHKTWDDLGEKDAFWAVLTGPSGASREWDLDAFLEAGRAEIVARLHELKNLGVEVPRRHALDFGCGVGRLTQALGAHFERATGVDIAESMVKRARVINKFPETVDYVVNGRPDLEVFADGAFTFVYSNIVLQHMAPQYSRKYMSEFFRVTEPGGIVVFQIPAEPRPGPAPVVTSNPRPLPKGTLKASIQPEVLELRCAPGANLPIVVSVTNLGGSYWAARGMPNRDFQIHVGNHWLNSDGTVHRFDDVRAELPCDVPPGGGFGLGLWTMAPTEPGTYLLELDLVQEQVAWFANQGSEPARLTITVDASLPDGKIEGLPSKMEMHGTRRADVEQIIREAGGELIHAEEDDAPGPEWVSYRYYSRRS